MMLKNIGYFFSEAKQSLLRNRLLSIATISTVSICILILGIVILASANAENLMQKLESDVEILVLLDRDLDSKDISLVQETIEKMEGIAEVKFVSKEEGLKKLEADLGQGKYSIADTLGKNPLPDSFEIKASDPHQVPQLAQQIKKVKGVYSANYGQGVVETLFSVTKWVRNLSVGFIVFLFLGAIFLIATTIRLAVYARRKEVYLMKLIGANDWFIRWPFFIEGTALGCSGSLLAILALGVGYNSILNHLDKLFFLPLVTDKVFLLEIYCLLFLAGGFLGVVGTYISLNRFLDV
ncbi:MAG: permease-like cell division protein FtsX [Syntrophomonadaceae bacterium]|jgi:cell division transport system permease protein